MRAIVKHWTQQSVAVPSIGNYKTTVTLIHPSVTTAVTLCGRMTRKQALARAWDALSVQRQFGTAFLQDLKDML